MCHMFILVACEESQAVTNALRGLGHQAFSCDLVPCSGGHPEWHIQGDVVPILDGACTFTTQGGELFTVDTSWDAIIAFPPCTYLTTTGNRWFSVRKYGDTARLRAKERSLAIDFFLAIASAKCDLIAIENPVGVMSTYFGKPDQIVQPFQFGDPYEKRTCLWLKGLPPLKPTDVVAPPPRISFNSGRSMPLWYAQAWNLPPTERAAFRSRTPDGLAAAMANQWFGPGGETCG